MEKFYLSNAPDNKPDMLIDTLQAGKVALMMCVGEDTGLRLRSTADLERNWLVVNGTILPAGALVTLITAQDAHSDEETRIEVYAADHRHAPRLKVSLDETQLQKLIRDGVANFKSSSGDDAGLTYCYDHYILR